MSALQQREWRASFDPWVYLYRARLLISHDANAHRKEIEQNIANLAALIESAGVQAISGWVYVARGELAEALGDVAGQRDCVAAAREAFLAFGATGHAGRLGGG